MRKILAILATLAVLTVCVYADGANNIIKVYLKNGQVDIYDPTEVSSITTTQYDVDMVKHDNLVSHVFEFKDNTSRFYGLDDIERVEFGERTSRVVKQGTREITLEDCSDIKSFDNNIITYSPETPSDRIPAKCELLYHEYMTTELFPYGLCVRVKSVNATAKGTEVTVEEVEPSEIYDSFLVADESPSNNTGLTDEGDASGSDIIITEDADDDSDTGLPTRSPAKAPVFSGQSNYRMNASVNMRALQYSYDVVTGDFRAVVSLSVKGDFNMKYRHEGKQNFTFSTNSTIAVPLPDTGEFYRTMKPSLTAKVNFKVKAKSADIEATLKRGYQTMFIISVANGDTVVYRPTINSYDTPVTKYSGTSHLDGSLTLAASFTLDTRPLYRKKGLRTIITTGPTLKSSIGPVQLDSLATEYDKDLYLKAKMTEVTTSTLSVSMTEYTGGKVTATHALNKLGKLTATNADGTTLMLPDFGEYVLKTFGGDPRFEYHGTGHLLAPVTLGADMLKKKTDKEPLQRLTDLGTMRAGSSFSTLAIAVFDSKYTGSKDYDKLFYRPTVTYGDYLIPGPVYEPDPDKCPYNPEHPHAIDLGLPSGTLWSCCNAGAAGPHGYGGAFKQTSSHEWGKDWILPTVAQIKELLTVCDISYISDCWRATGPNGNYIILPASGFIEQDGSRLDAGSCFYWWSRNTGFQDGELHGWHVRYTSAGRIIPDLDPRSDFGSFRLVKRPEK